MANLHVLSRMCCATVGEIVTIQRSYCRKLHHCRGSTWIGSRFRFFQLPKDSEGIRRALYCFFHLEALLCLSCDIKTPQVDCLTFVAQHHHIRQIQTGLHVSKITHEMFFWSHANHVIRVTQEDRIFRSLCTFLHVRRRIGYQLVITHVVDLLCAANSPRLRDIVSP